jgi:hypothetical protein
MRDVPMLTVLYVIYPQPHTTFWNATLTLRYFTAWGLMETFRRRMTVTSSSLIDVGVVPNGPTFFERLIRQKCMEGKNY